MKKTLCLTVLILASVSAYADECTDPKVCTLWAHEMCTLNQKFLGEDECLKCGCPKDKDDNQGTVSTKDDQTACCFNNMAWDSYAQIYREENVAVCGCPKDKDDNQGAVTTQDGQTACCFNNKSWDKYVQAYTEENAKVCGCPKDKDGNQGTPITKEGQTACCFNNKSWDKYVQTYREENAEVCGCPKDKDGNQGTSTTKDGQTECCFNNKAWSFVNQTYSTENAEVCGCPKDKDDNQGTPTTKDGKTVCCFNNMAWDSYDQTYRMENAAVCGCPKDAYDNQGTPTTQGGQTACCFNNKAWSFSDQNYSMQNVAVCGCPKDKDDNQGTLTTQDGQTACCFNNKAWYSFDQTYSTENAAVCGCPKDKDDNQGTLTTKDGQTACCFNNKAWSFYDQNYSIENPKVCGCPSDYTEMPDKSCCKNENVYNDPNTNEKKCCGIGHHLSEYVDINKNRKKQCCPNGQDASSYGNCCNTSDLELNWRIEKKYCKYFLDAGDINNNICPIPVPDSNGRKRCLTGANKTIFEETGVVLGCSNEVPVNCPSNQVVVEPLSSSECFCGCYNNDHCFDSNRVGIKQRCQADYTCAVPKKLTYNNITVVYDKFSGGEITEEKMKKILEALKEKLALTAEDSVTIHFKAWQGDSRMLGAGGYCYGGDHKNIHINAALCDVASDGKTLTCEGTILHENIHRIDRVNEPLWGHFESGLSRAYESLITETHAQGFGTVSYINNALKFCYKNLNGNVYSIMSTQINATEEEKNDCRIFTNKINSYGKSVDHYVNLGNAKLYFSNPKYFDPENCSGLRAIIEKEFLNSGYAKRGYIEDKIKTYEEMDDDWDYFRDKLEIAKRLDRLGYRHSGTKKTLTELLIDLYNKGSKVCISGHDFVNHPQINIEILKSRFSEFAEMNDFTVANQKCVSCWSGKGALVSEQCFECQKKLECITDEFNTNCTPIDFFNKYIGTSAVSQLFY